MPDILGLFGQIGTWLSDAIGWLLAVVPTIDPWLRLLIAGLGVMCETSILIGVIVPGDTVVLVASTGVRSTPEHIALILVVILGALVGESVGFAIGRWFGPALQRSRLGRSIGAERWDRASQYLALRGGPAIFLSRFLPVLHSVVPLTAGMSGIRYRKFIAWTLPACTIWAIAYVTVGRFAAESYRMLGSELKYAGFIFVGVILLFLVIVWVVKRILTKRMARTLAAHTPTAQPDASSKSH